MIYSKIRFPSFLISSCYILCEHGREFEPRIEMTLGIPPPMLGQKLVGTSYISRYQFMTFLVYLTFTPLHFLGFSVPRKIPDFPDYFNSYHYKNPNPLVFWASQYEAWGLTVVIKRTHFFWFRLDG